MKSKTNFGGKMANNERLLALAGQIYLFPEKHDQGRWIRVFEDDTTMEEARNNSATSCGTTACAAGWANILFGNGVFPARNDYSVYVRDADGPYYQSSAFGFQSVSKAVDYVPSVKRFRRVDISAYARELLGLSYGQASYMFSGGRSRAQLMNAIKYVIRNPRCSEMDLHVNC